MNIGQLCFQTTKERRKSVRNVTFSGPNVLFILFGLKIGRSRPTKHNVFKGKFPNLSQKRKKIGVGGTSKGKIDPISHMYSGGIVVASHIEGSALACNAGAGEEGRLALGKPGFWVTSRWSPKMAASICTIPLGHVGLHT